MTNTLKGALQGDGKTVSSSRLVMVAIILTIFVLWIAVGVLIAFRDGAWSEYEGWIEWGKEFAMVCIAPYVLGRFAGAFQGRTGGTG